MKLGEAFVNIRANLAPLKRGLSVAFHSVTAMLKKITSIVSRSAKWIAGGLLALGVASVKMASDAVESENLYEVSMGKMANATRKWSEQISKALKLNAFEVRNMVGTFNVMFTSMGLTDKEAANMSKSLTQLAYDMASFYNLRVEDAFEKLQAGITGEAEPLKRLGILINDNLIKQRALKEGVIKEKEQLTDLQKIRVRYLVLMDATAKAQGDLARTSTSFTNVLRGLWSTVKNVAVVFGKPLLEPLTKVSAELQNFFVGHLKMFEDWGKVVGDGIGKAVEYFNNLYETLQEKGWKQALTDLKNDFIEALKISFEFIKPKAEELGEFIGRGIIKGAKRITIKPFTETNNAINEIYATQKYWRQYEQRGQSNYNQKLVDYYHQIAEANKSGSL